MKNIVYCEVCSTGQSGGCMYRVQINGYEWYVCEKCYRLITSSELVEIPNEILRE